MKINEENNEKEETKGKVRKFNYGKIGLCVALGFLAAALLSNNKSLRKSKLENKKLLGINENQADMIKGQGKTIEKLCYQLGKAQNQKAIR